MKNIFLSGNVTKDQLAITNKANELLPNGHVLTPINQVWIAGAGTPDAQARTRIQMLMNCEELHLVKGWSECKTATLERDVAIRLGMPVYYH